MSPADEEPTLTTYRAYLAGLGTTGLLIGSFLLLLTVGSTFVAFRGVPGQVSNGELSRIELRQQREAARASGPTLLAARSLLDATGLEAGGGAAGAVLGLSAGGARGADG